jgi:hypothetical protein
MTHNRNELKELIAEALKRVVSDFYTHKTDVSPTAETNAEACLSAIEQSGCTICPNEPTRPMLEAARDWSTEIYGKPVGNGAASGVLKAMLSSSPFTKEKADG